MFWREKKNKACELAESSFELFSLSDSEAEEAVLALPPRSNWRT